MKYNVGDKLKPKKGYEEMCAIYRNNNGAYIVVTNISDYGSYHYDIYNKNDVKVEECFGCFGDEHLEPIPEDKKTVENKFKVGDRVKHKDKGMATVLDVGDPLIAVEYDTWDQGHSCDSYPEIQKRVKKRDYCWFEYPENIEPYEDEKKEPKKQFIVHCPTEELWRRVQEKMFSEGYEWIDGGKKYEDGWNRYKKQSYITVGQYDKGDMTYADRPFYDAKYPTIPIISAEEYLGEEEVEERLNGYTFTGIVWDEFALIPEGLKYIKNSPIKERKNPIMTGLKKVTNFIDSLQEPLRSYIRLGWVELEEDKYYVTSDGKQADAEIKFGLVKHKTLEAYAEAEVKRLEKEEKKK